MHSGRLWLVLGGLIASVLVACGSGGLTTTPLAPPSAVPTTLPTTTPGSTLKVSPASLSLGGIGSSYQATLTATQTNPVQMTVSGCTGVATATIGTIAASTTVVVVGVATGACTLVVADTSGQRVAVPIGVNQPAPTPPAVTPTPSSPGASPTPLDSSHVAFVVQIAPGAMSAAPNVTPSAVNVYITGQQTTTGPNATCSTTNFLAVTDARGDTAPFPTANATVAPIPFYGNGTTSGALSQVIQLPPLCSGRIYISVNGPLAITTTSGPAPWAVSGAAGFPAKYDLVEYTMPANGLAAPSTDVDTSQENMIGLDLTLNLAGTQSGSQTTGVKGGFMTQVYQGAATIGAPWGGVINAQWPTRLLSPLSVQYDVGSTGNASLPGFNPGTFLDAAIQTAWNRYQSPNCMNVTVSSATGDALAGKTLIGQVDANENFDFYDPTHVTQCAANLGTSNVVAQIPSPFNQNFWISSVASGWSSATGSELMENGPFLLPTAAVAAPAPASFTNSYAKSSADIGNTVATALNRGVFDPSINAAYAIQPYCPSTTQLYPATGASPTQNMWATLVWQAAKNTTYGYGKAYAIPYDDKCGFSTDIQDSGARVITVTVNPN